MKLLKEIWIVAAASMIIGFGLGYRWCAEPVNSNSSSNRISKEATQYQDCEADKKTDAPPLKEKPKSEEQDDNEVPFEDFNPDHDQGNGQDSRKQAFLESLSALYETLCIKYENPASQRQIMFFVESNITTKNSDAILHCLTSLDKKPEKVTAIKTWLESALKVEEGNYNEKEHTARAQDFKKPMDIGSIFKGMGIRT